MIQNNLNEKYSKGVVIIHWLTTILILILFPLGKYMEDLESAEKMELVKIHVILGIVVFILTIVRSWLFFKSPRPAKLKTGTKLNDRLAVFIHNSFYFLLFALSLSGIATMVFGGYAEAFRTGNPQLIGGAEGSSSSKGYSIVTIDYDDDDDDEGNGDKGSRGNGGEEDEDNGDKKSGGNGYEEDEDNGDEEEGDNYGEIHETLANIMIVLLFLHVIGVIKHYFFTGENALKRII